MKITKNQSGIAHLAILLLVIAAGIVGFTGWKVYDTNKKTNNSQTTTDSTSAASQAQTNASDKEYKEYKIPEGFVKYENKDLGFKFAYPKEWGDVTVSKDAGYSVYSYSADKPKDGTLFYFLKFSKLDTVSASLKSLKYTHGGRGGFEGDITGFCKLPNGYATNRQAGVITINEQGDYKASGKSECSTEKIKEEVIAVDSNAILLPKACYSEGCVDSEEGYKSILIINTGLDEFPGIVFTDSTRTQAESLKALANTYKKI